MINRKNYYYLREIKDNDDIPEVCVYYSVEYIKIGKLFHMYYWLYDKFFRHVEAVRNINNISDTKLIRIVNEKQKNQLEYKNYILTPCGNGYYYVKSEIPVNKEMKE